MWNPFGCKCCKVKDDEIKHLRGLVDRLMARIAPKMGDPDENLEIIPESEPE